MNMSSKLGGDEDDNLDADLLSGEFQSNISNEDTQVFECEDVDLSKVNMVKDDDQEKQDQH